ncbi:hypothetical protein BH09VER1_BH09VER1_52450 [soil metagenome]
MEISAIIPTYKRSKLLRETIESIWAQTRLPDEILIGDDSPDDITERMVKDELLPLSKVPIRFFHHSPSLREARNVDALYTAARGTHILHLHDDDPILPRCIELLAGAIEKFPQAVAAFGLQRVITEAGEYLAGDSDAVNCAYFRTSDRAGLVDGFFACAASMFPNNGFLVEAKAAREVGYNDHGKAGSAVDYYFGLRLGQLRRPVVFINEHTATVRMTLIAESRTATADNSYRRMTHLLASLEPGDLTPDLLASVDHHMFYAIANAAMVGRPGAAWRWFFSPYFRGQILSVKGLKALRRLLIASAKHLMSPKNA